MVRVFSMRRTKSVRQLWNKSRGIKSESNQRWLMSTAHPTGMERGNVWASIWIHYSMKNQQNTLPCFNITAKFFIKDWKWCSKLASHTVGWGKSTHTLKTGLFGFFNLGKTGLGIKKITGQLALIKGECFRNYYLKQEISCWKKISCENCPITCLSWGN